jgi:WD40 repeat protein
MNDSEMDNAVGGEGHIHNDVAKTQRWRRRRFFIAGGKLATLAVGGFVALGALADERGPKPRTIRIGNPVCLACSPNGKLIAVGVDFFDQTSPGIRVYDVATGKEVDSMTGHTRRVLSVAFSSDGKVLASASDDHNVRLWDVATRKELAILKDHDLAVTCVAFSRDGKRLATASLDRTVKLWDISQKKVLRTLPFFHDFADRVSFSPDGKMLAAVGGSKDGLVWDAETFKVRTRLSGHTEDLTDVCWSPNGTMLATTSYDSSARVWSTTDFKTKMVIPVHPLGLGVAFTPDGKWLAVCGGSNKVELFSPDTGRRERAAPSDSSGEAVDEVVFSSDGRLMAGLTRRRALLWDMDTDRKDK